MCRRRRGAGPRQPDHEQHVDQALDRCSRPAWRAAGCGRTAACDVLTQRVDPLALAPRDAEHLRLLGQPDRLGDAAGVAHLGAGERPRAAHADAPAAVAGARTAQRRDQRRSPAASGFSASAETISTRKREARSMISWSSAARRRSPASPGWSSSPAAVPRGRATAPPRRRA